MDLDGMSPSGMDGRRYSRDYSDETSDDTRAQSKTDRPKSRRGIKDFGSVSSSHSSNSGRYPTSSRTMMNSARPPTGSLHQNRAPSAASRLSIATSSGITRLSTGISVPGQTPLNINMIDRPITQHGIAGVRPGTTRAMTRQIQDKRYYLGLLQLKIRELSQEIGAIFKDIENQNKEKAKLLHSDKRAKDLAAELTTLQAELAEYNIIVEKMTLDIDKDTIELEAQELAIKNEDASSEVEHIFEERKNLERALNDMKKDIESEKRRTERLISSMDKNMREAYETLSREKVELQERANEMQRQLDELTKEQLRLEEEIALSPLKQEAVKLHLKIMEAETKRDKLREEEGNKLPPEKEREKLLQKIKQDNVDVAAAEARLAETNRKILEMEQQLEQFESDMDDAQSEKQVKYNELRKREEVMEQFMATFEQNKEEELKKFRKLEQTIIERLAEISSVMDVDGAFVTNEEMTIFQSIPSLENYELGDHDRSLDGLSKEHLKLRQIFGKMEMLESRLKTESVEVKEKIDKWEKEVERLENLNDLTGQSDNKREELENEVEELRRRKSASEKDLKLLQDEYNTLKKKLDKNLAYNQISALENKLETLNEDSKKLEEFVRGQVERANYDSLKERVYNLMNEYGKGLQESLKISY